MANIVRLPPRHATQHCSPHSHTTPFGHTPPKATTTSFRTAAVCKQCAMLAPLLRSCSLSSTLVGCECRVQATPIHWLRKRLAVCVCVSESTRYWLSSAGSDAGVAVACIFIREREQQQQQAASAPARSVFVIVFVFVLVLVLLCLALCACAYFALSAFLGVRVFRRNIFFSISFPFSFFARNFIIVAA